MAKAKVSSAKVEKVSFGFRKKGKAKKRYNKHDHTSKTYRGQGR